MYTIIVSKRFRKQAGKLKKSNPSLLKKLETTIETLRLGQSLSPTHRDHKLTGHLTEFRECHVAPDWLLIYRQHKDVLILELLSTGTHTTLLEKMRYIVDTFEAK
ncbi:MAG: type II toxin-antitoxin system YafQ family toxin [Patescibacteria group bacterium]